MLNPQEEQQSPPIAALPAELLVKIASNVDSLQDLVAFSTTCPRFQAIFHQNTFEIARHVIARSVECERQAWALVSVQEDVAVEVARGPKMTPRLVQRLARNDLKLKKTMEWFNKTEMRNVRRTFSLPFPLVKLHGSDRLTLNE